jgi:hypothetical protein
VLPSAALRFVAGAAAVASYRATPAATRTFCRHRDSNLEWRGSATPERIDIALGTLDDDPGIRPQRHMDVASRAPGSPITDRLPQFAADADRDSE